MGQYDAQILVAKRLLARFGESSTLIRTLGGTPSDPNKPWEPGTPTTTETTVSAAHLNEAVIRTDALVKQGESFVILAASDLASAPDPSVDSLRRANGKRYTILESSAVAPNGQAIIYELKVKS